MNGWRRERLDRTVVAEYRKRWAFPAKARVTHPNHRPVIVPAMSKYAAILCAAEIWRVDWMSVRDAQVIWCEETGTKQEGEADVLLCMATPLVGASR